MAALRLILLLFLSGCSYLEETTGGTLYGEIAIAYQMDEHSDWYVRTEREWQCSDNWQAHFEGGIKWKNVWRGQDEVRAGYHHQSWWSCGSPWNNNAELYQDDIRITYGWE